MLHDTFTTLCEAREPLRNVVSRCKASLLGPSDDAAVMEVCNLMGVPIALVRPPALALRSYAQLLAGGLKGFVAVPLALMHSGGLLMGGADLAYSHFVLSYKYHSGSDNGALLRHAKRAAELQKSTLEEACRRAGLACKAARGWDPHAMLVEEDAVSLKDVSFIVERYSFVRLARARALAFAPRAFVLCRAFVVVCAWRLLKWGIFNPSQLPPAPPPLPTPAPPAHTGRWHSGQWAGPARVLPQCG